jgi:NAD(P)-dependent dehydrogenase (short-subunit alcohol dehydrogenase family)
MTTSPPVAIVTGGARRIGRAIVEDLAAHGWAVAIHYNHSGNEAEELAAKLTKSFGKAAVVDAELDDLDAVLNIVPRVIERLGKPSLLVNNASIYEGDDIGALNPQLWQRQMTINLTAPVFLAEAFAKAVPESVEGNIVNVIDQRVLKPTPRYFSYQLSKQALWHATESLAQALAPRVRVNAIAPGPVIRNEKQTDAEWQRQIAAVPLERNAELAEFGRTIRYFVENRSITGQMICLDGGQHLAWLTPDIAHYDRPK